MRAIARTALVPPAARVGALSALLRRPRGGTKRWILTIRAWDQGRRGLHRRGEVTMLTLQELDESVSIREQLKDGSKEPVVLVNIFHVAPEQTDALISAWADD